jgi:general secretion pathway protein D
MLDVFTDNVYRMMLDQQQLMKPNTPGTITGPYGYINNGDRTSPVAPGVPTGSRTEILNNPLTRGGGAFSGGTGGNDQKSNRDGFDGFNNTNTSTPGGGSSYVERAGQLGFGGGLQGGGGPGGLQGGGAQGPGGGAGGLQGGQGQQGGAQSLLPNGINPGDIIALPADNSIIINLANNPEAELALRNLREIIRLLDVKPRQINIRTEFVTVTANDTNAFGISWAFQKVNLIGGVSTGFSTTNTAFLQYATGNLQAQLSWILTSGKGKLVAAPQASTLNNLAVTFSVSTTVPVFISTPIVTAGGQTVIANTIVPLPVTTGMFVVPRINGDESITLFGAAFSSSVGAPTVGPGGESFPNITTQTAPIQRIIRNGDTIAIAGLTSKNDVVQTNKVPLLGDLPLIGNLFRSRSVTTADSELLVFITPTIIQERQSNATVGAGGNLLAPPGGPGAGGGGVNPGP